MTKKVILSALLAVIAATLAVLSYNASASGFTLAEGSGAAASYATAGSASSTIALGNGAAVAGSASGAWNNAGVSVDADTSHRHGATLDLGTYSVGGTYTSSYVGLEGYAGGYAVAGAAEHGYGRASGYVYDYIYEY